jgi:hypothetical protein
LSLRVRPSDMLWSLRIFPRLRPSLASVSLLAYNGLAPGYDGEFRGYP